MKNNKMLGVIAMIFVALFWGLSFFSIQVVGTTIGAFTLSTARFAIAAVAFTSYYVLMGLKRGQFEKIEKRDMKRIVINALIGIAIYYPASMWAINLIPASAGSVLSAIQPILMIILEAIIIKIAITKKNALAVVISVVGALLVVGKINLSGDSSFIGYIVMFLCTCLWCLYTVLQRPLIAKYSSITINVYQFIIGTVVMSPSFFLEKNDWAAMTGIQWFNLIYLGVVCSGMCFVLYNFAIPRIGATTSSLFLNAGPIITTTLGIVLFNQYPTVLTAVGVLFTVSGVTLATVDFKKKAVVSE